MKAHIYLHMHIHLSACSQTDVRRQKIHKDTKAMTQIHSDMFITTFIPPYTHTYIHTERQKETYIFTKTNKHTHTNKQKYTKTDTHTYSD